MSNELRFGRAAIVVLLMGVIGISGYLTTSPGATTGVAIGMVLACGAVLVALGLLFGASRRTNRGDPR